MQNLGQYRNPYIQSYRLLLVNIFESFQTKYIETYKLNPACFLSAPRLEWQTCLKKTKVGLESLTNVDMLLTIAKGIRGGI